MNEQGLFQVVVSGQDGAEYAKGGLTWETAQAVENAVSFSLEAAGGVWDDLYQVWRFEGGREVEVLVVEDFDEEDCFPGGEFARGWASESAEEYRKIALQNEEDARLANKTVVSYQGVRGVWNPEDGWIFEP